MEEKASLPSLMSAVILDSLEEGPKLIETKRPIPSENEVLIKLICSPCTSTDVSKTSSESALFPAPITLGSYASGIIIQLGKSVPQAYLHKKCFLCTGQLSHPSTSTPPPNYGLWAQYATKSYTKVYLFSESLSFEQTCSMYMAPMTALSLFKLFKNAKRDNNLPHKACIITAASSSVSKILLMQFNRKRIPVIAIVRSQSQLRILQQKGASLVVDVSQQGFFNRLKVMVRELDVSFCFDCVGGDLGTQILAMMPPFSRYVVFGAMDPSQQIVVGTADCMRNNKVVQGWFYPHYDGLKSDEQVKKELDKVNEDLVCGGDIFGIPVVQKYVLKEFQEALSTQKQVASMGMNIILPNDEIEDMEAYMKNVKIEEEKVEKAKIKRDYERMKKDEERKKKEELKLVEIEEEEEDAENQIYVEDKIDENFLIELFNSEKCKDMRNDGKIQKVVIEEGKGIEVANQCVIYYKSEIRFSNGELCFRGLGMDMKGINKHARGKNKTTSGNLDILFNHSKRGEEAWYKIHDSCHNYKQLDYYLNKTEEEKEKYQDFVYARIIIHRLRHIIQKTFPTRLGFVKKVKEVCLDYIQFGDNDSFKFAFQLYSEGINDLETQPKKIIDKMSAERLEERRNLLTSLYSNIVFVGMKLERYQQSKEFAEKGLEHDPSNLKCMYRLGIICRKLNIEEKAYYHLSRCLKREPQNPNFLEHRSFINEYEKKTGNKKKKFYEKYAEELEKAEEENLRKNPPKPKSEEEDDDYEEVEEMGEFKMEQGEKGMVFKREKIKKRVKKKGKK